MMDNLVQKLNWDMPFIKNQCMFVYAEADLDSNQKMQEPLQKLYQYENHRLERNLEKQMIFNVETTKVAITKSRMKTLIDVKTDLEGRLMEDV